MHAADGCSVTNSWRQRGALDSVEALDLIEPRALRSRWTEVSRGDCSFPCAIFSLCEAGTQEHRSAKARVVNITKLCGVFHRCGKARYHARLAIMRDRPCRASGASGPRSLDG